MSARTKKSISYGGDERRKAKRILVEESFSLYIVIPKKMGMARIYMRDISKTGLCLRTEVDMDFSVGQVLDIRLYTNPIFYLPLKAKVLRVHNGELGLEYIDADSKSVGAITKLLEFFEVAADAGEQTQY